MRIIAGEWKGRTIAAPSGRGVRPTADRVREAWMSIVHPYLHGARVLDLFAGSGALGLEALSRGATFVDFVESSARTLGVLRKNVEVLGAKGRCAFHRTEAEKFISKLSTLDSRPFYDIAFVDPPYQKGFAPAIVDRWLQLPFAAILGIEHSPRETMPATGDTRRYGDTSVTIYRTKP